MPKLTKTKRLRDSYRFPGFHPALIISGMFGDPRARVIRLTRRSKKRCAEFVAGYKVGGMTANCASATRSSCASSRATPALEFALQGWGPFSLAAASAVDRAATSCHRDEQWSRDLFQ